MTTTEEQISLIEKEIRETPYHKATEHYIGRLRAKLSRLRFQSVEKSTKKGGGGGYSVKKQGDATVTIVGPPSVGKSTLINKLTNAKSKIAPYAFTTVSVIPGMMKYKDARIQILDVPGLIEGAELGKGKGKEVLSVIRGSDLIIILCDVDRLRCFSRILNTLEESGIRINKIPPQVNIEKKLKGGIQLITSIKQKLDKETIKEIAKEFRITNADVIIKEKLTIERLIDSFSKNSVYVNAIYLVNKVDKGTSKDIESANKLKLDKEPLLISAEKGVNINKLKDLIWENLNFTRVYLVKKNEQPGNNNPIITKKDTKLSELAEIIGTEFAEDKKSAQIWGPGAKFPGQRVSISKRVVENMQIRFVV